MKAKMTKKEKQWVDKLQSVLDECPSERMLAYTIGDPSITVFDSAMYDDFVDNNTGQDDRDICSVVQDSGSKLVDIRFPFQVWATSG